ncbi:MAG: VOC family protein [Actinomycetota bacterium]|nr:VOC family protein [Actinomycetota bacterium]
MDQYNLDHVALAAADTAPALAFLTGELGGTVIFGGQAIGFRPMQVWIGTPDGDGMPIELLEPWAAERNDFLARFVDRHGAGPHHLTFKVPDLTAALDRMRGAGFNPVGVNTADPGWKEAFLLPREAHGTVVQLAESGYHQETRAEGLAWVAKNGPNASPRWWQDPTPAQGPPARLRRVVVATPALPAAVAFFGGLLQGDVVAQDTTWAELAWPSGARIRVEENTAAAPGIDRLDVEGLATEREIIGTRFVPA